MLPGLAALGGGLGGCRSGGRGDGPVGEEGDETRGPDAAASAAGAAELMMGVRKGPAQKKSKNHLCDYAATET